MSWEVPIMVSKRSCFNPTLLYRDLQRFWPCWTAVLIVALLLLPVNMASDFARRVDNGFPVDITDAARIVCNSFELVLVAAAGLGIVVAVMVSRHLFTARAVNFYHALPIRREGILFTNIVTGLIMLWGPILITALVTMAVELSFGVFDPISLGQLLLVYLCSSLLFFSMGLLSCHVTGMAIAAIGLYVILNFIFIVGYAILALLLEKFLVGYMGDIGTGETAVRFLTPFVNLLSSCGTSYHPYGRDEYALARLLNMQLPLMYAVVAVVILAAVLLLYRSRKSERAGDLLAFGWLRPVCKVCFAFFGGMGLGILTAEMYDLYDKGFFVILLLVVVWSFVAWMIAEMLVRKTIRVFKKPAFVQWGVTALCLCIVLLGLQLDVFGLEKRIPDREDIAVTTLTINGRYIEFEDPTVPMALHEELIANREVLRSAEIDDDIRTTGVRVSYSMKDGVSYLERYYQVPTVQTAAEMTPLQQSIYDILTDPDMVMEFYFDGPLERKSELKMCEVYYFSEKDQYHKEMELTTDEAWMLYQAIVADIYAGNINYVDDFCWENYEKNHYSNHYDASIQFNYLHHALEQELIAAAEGRTTSVGWQWSNFDVHDGMTNTLAVLAELGWEP